MSQTNLQSPLVALLCPPSLRPEGEALAERLGCSLRVGAAASDLPETGFVLQLQAQGLALQALGHRPPGPIRVDFVTGSAAHRRRFGGGKGQLIARAVGLQRKSQLQVLDVTAGLGGDAFVLASLGCQVQMLERSELVAELLADGLRRAAAAPEIEAIAARLDLIRADSREHLRGLARTGQQFDVVYLDPMFPERSKSARVKKEMAAFHQLLGTDPDADELLPLALPVARARVVVKRPRKAPWLGDREPTLQLSGKTSRYDIYVNAAL